MADAEEPLDRYWSVTPEALLSRLDTTRAGLSSEEAARRLEVFGPNVVTAHRPVTAVGLFLDQLKNPLVIILIFAAVVSALMRDWISGLMVLIIVLGSAVLGFVREYNAHNAVARLMARVTINARVLRDGEARAVPLSAVVPGDLVLLSAGSVVPADGVVLEAIDFFVDQAVLTGETFPVEKKPGVIDPDAGLAMRNNCIFQGTHARVGTATCLIVRTGRATAFGHIAQRLSLRPPETEFERGVRHFGYLLARAMLVMVLIVFALNVFLEKPVIDALLFAVALAVGMTPELLPAIFAVNLSKSAQNMAAHGVIVRRLSAIENFGSMNVLCTDKTGTLTAGVVRLDKACGPKGAPSGKVFRLAWLNARFQTGLLNPLDEAILAETPDDIEGIVKLDEIPYDFVRKRLSVVVGRNGQRLLITKGALEHVLEVCTHVIDDGNPPLDQARTEGLRAAFAAWSEQGFRVLGVAVRDLGSQTTIHRQDEHSLGFAGFLLFFDPPKPDVKQTIVDLEADGVALKIITGDNALVARHVAETVGLKLTGVLTGAALDQMADQALWHAAEKTNLFAEVDPNQKERIILALKKMGHVVGYMGDGINDAPALHAADVGISVDSAVDVAKEAADFVLLEQDLEVLQRGIREGRTTFANSLKYVLTTTSANLGNMLSMAVASIFLPFLPLLAEQILLNNILSDIPAMALVTDRVDRELVERPRRWNIVGIRNFMMIFGPISSLFDGLTFFTLLFVFRADTLIFRTGWFVESLLTELFIAWVVRTRQPLWRSLPSRYMVTATLSVATVAVVLPYLPFSDLLGFAPLPLPVLAAMLGITLLYVVVTESVKRVFYRKAGV